MSSFLISQATGGSIKFLLLAFRTASLEAVSTDQVSDHVSDQVASLLRAIGSGEIWSSALMEMLGLSHRPTPSRVLMCVTERITLRDAADINSWNYGHSLRGGPSYDILRIVFANTEKSEHRSFDSVPVNVSASSIHLAAGTPLRMTGFICFEERMSSKK